MSNVKRGGIVMLVVWIFGIGIGAFCGAMAAGDMIANRTEGQVFERGEMGAARSYQQGCLSRGGYPKISEPPTGVQIICEGAVDE